MSSIGRIELSRIPISVWLFALVMSYAPLITHAAFPWFDYSDKYYTVSIINSLINNQLNALRTVNNSLLQAFGGAIYMAAKAFELFLMLIESLATGFMPTWKLLGLDVDIGGVNLAVVFSSISLAVLGWTAWKAWHGGLRV